VPVASKRVEEWLLESEQPAVRYRALTGLLGRSASDPEVRAARAEITERGWAAEILARREPGLLWGGPKTFYRPKYTSTNWQMLVLSDLGVTREDPGVEEACEAWIARDTARNGAIGGSPGSAVPHHCAAGNYARALIRFGYGDDDRIRRTMEWLESSADPKGGWSCFVHGRNLDSWEGLSAFAVYPRSKWTPSMRACVARGAEFFLERELHRQGERYAPWYRFHYPVHYYYDLLVGLDVLTRLGYGSDPRLGYALDLLERQRRADGRWDLGPMHPDVEGPIVTWFEQHPNQRPIPMTLETPGQPSKMITLTALEVLARVDGSARTAAGSRPRRATRGRTRSPEGSTRPGRRPRSRGRTASS
jgi:hypothetical protein